MMEIEKSPLYLEMLRAVTQNDKKSQTYMEAVIHLDDKGNLFNPFHVYQVSIERDYAMNFADEMCVTVSIPLGKYALKVYPNRNNLKMTLKKYYLKERTSEIDYTIPPEVEQFTAILIEEGPAITAMQGIEGKDEYALDLVNILEIKFQLFNKANEKLRINLTGGIYRQSDVKSVILTDIDRFIKTLKIDEKRNIKGVDFVDPNNEKIHEQVLIPHGTHLVDMPGHIQKRYGVYASGLGSYIQNDHWFIYPLFDTNRYNKTVRTLNMYVMPKGKFPEFERTYHVKNKTVNIITTAGTDFQGDNEINYLVQGNGVRFVEADGFVDSFNSSKDNKTVVVRKENNNEFAAVDKTDLNYAPLTEQRITANEFVQFTELAKRKGGLLKVVWENSDPKIIEPGMVTRIVYQVNEELKEAYGVVLAANHMTIKVGDVQMKKHITNSQLVVFTNLKVPNQQ